MKKKKPMPLLVMILCDMLLIAAFLLTFSYFHHVRMLWGIGQKIEVLDSFEKTNTASAQPEARSSRQSAKRGTSGKVSRHQARRESWMSHRAARVSPSTCPAPTHFAWALPMLPVPMMARRIISFISCSS